LHSVDSCTSSVVEIHPATALNDEESHGTGIKYLDTSHTLLPPARCASFWMVAQAWQHNQLEKAQGNTSEEKLTEV